MVNGEDQVGPSARVVAGVQVSTLITTIDLGNTRCKVCDWWLESGRAAARVRSGAVIGNWAGDWRVRQTRSPERRLVALSSVADREREMQLASELERAFGASFVGTPDAGLDNRCLEPERVGRDRLFAARGAFELLGLSCIVVDVGTAMTVDALLVASTGRPAFLGGAIAPGPALLTRSLAQGTARLPEVQADCEVAALGRDTRQAIASGVAHGLRGAARELVERIAGEAGLERAAVVITGGANAFLARLDFDGRPRVDVADLVQIGLASAALDIGGAPAATPRYGCWSTS